MASEWRSVGGLHADVVQGRDAERQAGGVCDGDVDLGKAEPCSMHCNAFSEFSIGK